MDCSLYVGYRLPIDLGGFPSEGRKTAIPETTPREGIRYLALNADLLASFSQLEGRSVC
jgi:hypothetical protein